MRRNMWPTIAALLYYDVGVTEAYLINVSIRDRFMYVRSIESLSYLAGVSAAKL